MAPPSFRTRRRRRRGVSLASLALVAGCSAPLPGSDPPGETDPAPALTNRPLPADSPDESRVDVRLEALSVGTPAPGARARNPFRLERPPMSPILGGEVPVEGPGVPPGAVDGWQPAAAAEAVRFLGILDAPESAGLVGVLADDSGVYHGRVNEVVGGRYRIVALDRTSLVIERIEDGERRTLSPSGR